MRWIFLIFVLGCQVDESDNYYKHQYPPGYNNSWQIIGRWNCEDLDFEIRSSELLCDGDGADVREIQQKYIGFSRPACGFSWTAAYQLLPPYDLLKIMRGSTTFETCYRF